MILKMTRLHTIQPFSKDFDEYHAEDAKYVVNMASFYEYGQNLALTPVIVRSSS